MSLSYEQSVNLLRRAQDNKRLPHALLFSGPAAAEKEKLALSLAKDLNGVSADSLKQLRHPMCQVISPSSKSRSILIEQIRELEPFLALRAAEGMHKLVFILEADRMKDEASNAFLKTLEEPPPHTHIVLISERPSHMLATILSRCIHLKMRPQSQDLVLSPVQEQFLPSIRQALAHVGDELYALALRADFTELLAQMKEEHTSRLTSELKEEARSISEGTGIRDWEAQQKDKLSAKIETENLAAREEMLELLSLSFGQAVLLASNAPHVQPLCPELHDLAQQCPVHDLLRRMRAVDELRRTLNFNVNAPLALDVALLAIIGDAPTKKL